LAKYESSATVFSDHLADEDALAERLAPFDIVCLIRERTALPRDLMGRLPKLKLIASTGAINAAVDVAAAKEHGIEIVQIRRMAAGYWTRSPVSRLMKVEIGFGATPPLVSLR
jgi:phosphoglycerate dehydrogenase-like enzyme